MHLSDIQLLELDEEGKSHLAHCEECTRLFQMRLAIQDTLKSLPDFEARKDSWCSISAQLTYQKKSATKRYLAATAGILLVVSTLYLTTSYKQQQLNTLIKENQQLNLLIEQKLSKNPSFRSISAQLLELELSEVEYELQQAYVTKASAKEKVALWSSRRDLLLKLLKSPPKKSEIFI